MIFNVLSLLLLLSSVSARIGQEGDQQARRHLTIRKAADNDKIQNQYIVRISSTTRATQKDTLLNALMDHNTQGRIIQEYSRASFYGFAVSGISEAAMYEFAQLYPEDIVEIEEDAMVHAHAVEWNLDRIDGRTKTIDSKYDPAYTGAGVYVYVLDTGVRATHVEFEDRVLPGLDVTNDDNGIDGHGHGTHVAATVAGKNYGVAKKANIVPIKVLDVNGSGSVSGVVRALEWVVEQHTSRDDAKSVANMSLGGGFSQSLNDAVKAAVDEGVIVVVSAGNDGADACDSSPASESKAITVGSTSNSDTRSSFSNWGSCVDIFAPGSAIKSAWKSSNTATNTISGTSMSCPHVAGAAAIFLESQDASRVSVENVVTSMLGMATPGVVANAGEDSPNLFLYVEPYYGEEPRPTPAPGGTDPEPDPELPYPKPLPFHTRVTMQLVYDDSPFETNVQLHRRFLQSSGASEWRQEGIWDAPLTESADPLVITRDLPNGYYAYTFNDADGICCTKGNGSFTLSSKSNLNGNEIVFASGGEFETTITVEFRVRNGLVLSTYMD